MCKAWTLRYACTHSRTVRRSFCRGTFCGPSLRTGEPKIRCSGADPLLLTSISLCGPCKLAQVEAQLHAEVETLRHELAAKNRRSDIAAKLAIAENGLSNKLWKLTMELPPDGTLREIVRPARSRRPGSLSINGGGRSSLLSMEVRPEDVVEKQDDWATGWAAGWPSSAEPDEDVSGTKDDPSLICEDWTYDDLAWSVPTLDPTTGTEQDAEVELQETKIRPPSGGHLEPACETEHVPTRKEVIPPHRRRREGSTIRDFAQQVILDLRSMHACGGYQLGVAVSN